MPQQNVISTGIPAIFNVGTKTFTLTITAGTGSTSWGRIDPRVEGLIAPSFNSSDEETSNTLVFSQDMNGHGLQFFREFWQNKPFYIRRLNIRASNAAYMPTTISVNTPDIFTGNIGNQTISVGANQVQNAYQDNIVTLDTRLVVGKTDWIEIGGVTTAGQVLNLDFTISVNASLEEALSSFVQDDNSIK